MTDHSIESYIKGLEARQAKSIWQSKTFWFNALTFLVAVAAILADPNQYGAEVARWALIVVAAGNVLLRLVTTGPVALRPGQVVAAIGPATLTLIIDQLRERKDKMQAEAVALSERDPQAAQWAEAKAVALNEAVILIEWILIKNANSDPEPS